LFNKQAASAGTGLSDADALKNLVRDKLQAMNTAMRVQFIQALETELRRIRLSMRVYLVPLGILATKPDELMPMEVGHLIRFLKLNVPEAVPACERAMAGFGILPAQASAPGDYLAA